MKKVITVLVVFVILGLMILLTGCNEESQQSSRETLLDPEKASIEFAKQWVEKYGTSPESVDNYNHVLVREIVNQNAAIMNKLAETVKGGMEETGKQLSALSARIDELESEICPTEPMKLTVGPYDGTVIVTPLKEGDKE